MTRRASVDSVPSSPDEHRDKIEDLRKRCASVLEKFPAYDTDYSLQRWLRNEHYNVDVTVPKLEWSLNTLGNLGAFNNNIVSIENFKNIMSSITRAAEYFPGGVMGRDKDGNVVVVQPLGRVRPKSLIQVGRISDLYRASILECEATMMLVREEEKARGQKLGVILVYDIAGFSMDMVFMPAVKVYLNVLSLLQFMFPDSVSKVYVINAPSAVNFLYNMAKAVLSKKTIKRVEFLGSDWQDVLKKNLGEENILPYWGGSKQAEKPTGWIRMGGEIPSALKEEIRKTMRHVPDNELTTVSLEARKGISVPVEVIRPGATLSWYFTVSFGDVDFWITVGEQEVWPRFRISTEFVPEYGKIICGDIGTYLLHFDNKHGKIWSKQIAYCFKINEDCVLAI